MGKSTNNRRMFKEVAVGDRPSAAEQNRLTAAVSALTAGPNEHRRRGSRVRVMRTGEVGGKFGTGDSRHDISSQFMHYNREDTSDNSSQSRDLGAGFQVSDRAPVTNVCDPHNLIYDRHEIIMAVYSEQADKWFPITFRAVRHAVTRKADGSTAYPGYNDDRDVYPISFIRLRYHENPASRQSHDLSYLASDVNELNSDQSSLFSESGDTQPTLPDGYVHNIVPYAYIPENRIIQVYNVGGQWFTEFRAINNLIVYPSQNAGPGGTVVCRIYSNGVYIGKNVTCRPEGLRVYKNQISVAWQDETDGRWYVAPWHCEPSDSISGVNASESS